MAGLIVRPIAVEDTRPLRQAVLRPHQTLEELASHEPPDRFAVGAFDVGAFDREKLIAVGLVGREGDPGAWRIRGMATEPGARGRGAGTAVLDALMCHARERGATRVWASVRTPARALYERAGFRQTSDVFELPEIGPHVIMGVEV